MLTTVSTIMSTAIFGLFAVVPTSTNYSLKAFDFGNGGGKTSSTNYGLNSITNGQTGNTVTSTAYLAQPGIASTINANVPPAPIFTNPSNYYERLNLTLATGNNPTSTKYAIAISYDNFVTTNYVKSDNTIGTSFSIANYQTYALWGGATGFDIIGLQPSTTYKVKVKAFNGSFSETAYGPTATAATVSPSVTFAITTTLSAVPPFGTSFASLAPGSVYAADADTQVALTTNALFGGTVYVNDLHSGLYSNSANYTIASATANLAAASKGYGAQVTSVGQTSGGPLSSVSPYDGAGDSVGAMDTTLQPVVITNSAIANANATIRLKAKTDALVPASSDYTDTLTFTAVMVF